MIKTEKVIIEGKEYWLKCTIATVELYERMTGSKFATVLSNIAKMQTLGDDLENMMDAVLMLQTDTMKLAYVMILEAQKDGLNKDFTMSIDEWLSSLGALEGEALKGVLATAMSVFPRALSKRTEEEE